MTGPPSLRARLHQTARLLDERGNRYHEMAELAFSNALPELARMYQAQTSAYRDAARCVRDALAADLTIGADIEAGRPA